MPVLLQLQDSTDEGLVDALDGVQGSRQRVGTQFKSKAILNPHSKT
jgi:hypothetical protein